MVKQDIVNFVNEAEKVIGAYQDALRKAASAPAVEAAPAPIVEDKKFDSAALLKVANDIHTLYGKPSNIQPEQLVEHWQSNPDSLVGTLQKMASAQLAHVASGNHLGAPSERVEERKAEVVVDADDAFKGKYSNR